MKTLAAFLFIALSALADETPKTFPIDELADPTPWLTAKVQSSHDPHWYGTAILFEIQPKEFFFLTNRHVLPRDRARWNEIQILSPVHGYRADAVRVLGVAPGHDLAVVAIARRANDPVDIGALESLLARAFVADDIGGKTLPQGILGFPGIQEFAAELRPGFKVDPWRPATYFGRPEKVDPVKLSPPTELTRLTACPAPFLRYCYRTPISSAGFSGGALEVEHNGRRVAGIVSHFSPLGPDTYVIPMPLALRIARRLVKDGDLLIDDSGKFRFLSDESIERLDRPGVKLRKAAPGATSPGGHDGAGGGGDSGPGGHDGAGGGGETGAGAAVIANPHGNLALIGAYSELRSAAGNPADWTRPGNPLRRVMSWMPAFKGITATLDYLPGFRIGDTVYARFAGEPVTTLSGLLRRMIEIPEGRPERDFTRRDWPRGLGILADRDLGRRAYGDIRRFRSPTELSKIDDDWKNDSSFSLPTLKPLTQIHSRTPGTDLLITYSSARNQAPVRVAQVARVNGQVDITLLDAFYGSFTVRFPDRFQQLGDRFYRYHGEFTVELPFRPWDESRARYRGRAHGVAVLQHDPAERIWEMKILMVYQPETGKDRGKTILTPEAIRVDGLYLPLTAIGE